MRASDDTPSRYALAYHPARGESARETQRIPFEKRLREIVQGPDGAIWVLEDKEGGRLLKLTPG